MKDGNLDAGSLSLDLGATRSCTWRPHRAWSWFA